MKIAMMGSIHTVGWEKLKENNCEVFEITNFEKFCLVCLKAAKNKKKIFTAFFLGNKGGKLKKVSIYSFTFPSNNTSIIHVGELLIGQVLCDYLEQNVW